MTTWSCCVKGSLVVEPKTLLDFGMLSSQEEETHTLAFGTLHSHQRAFLFVSYNRLCLSQACYNKALGSHLIWEVVDGCAVSSRWFLLNAWHSVPGMSRERSPSTPSFLPPGEAYVVSVGKASCVPSQSPSRLSGQDHSLMLREKDPISH